MTIHHDKLAYGKLAPTSENLSEEQMAAMLAELNGVSEGAAEDTDKTSAETAYKKDGIKRKRKK